MTLFVSESGTPGAPAIVFLHGSGTAGWMWTPQLEGLSDYHCLNIDLPGHGRSVDVEYVSLADTANQVAEIIRTRAARRRASVVGLSLGGLVGLHLLALHNEVVEFAVLSSVVSRPIANRRMLNTQLAVVSRLKRYRWFSWLFVKSMRVPADVTPVYVDSLRTMSRRAFDGIGRETIDFALPAGLADARMPVLVAAGSADAAPMVNAVRHLAMVLPCATGVLAPGLHHAWNGEDPTLFTAAVRAWLGKTDLPDGLTRVSS